MQDPDDGLPGKALEKVHGPFMIGLADSKLFQMPQIVQSSESEEKLIQIRRLPFESMKDKDVEGPKFGEPSNPVQDSVHVVMSREDRQLLDVGDLIEEIIFDIWPEWGLPGMFEDQGPDHLALVFQCTFRRWLWIST